MNLNLINFIIRTSNNLLYIVSYRLSEMIFAKERVLQQLGLIVIDLEYMHINM